MTQCEQRKASDAERGPAIGEGVVGMATISDRDLSAKSPYADHGLISHLVREAFVKAGLGRKNQNVPLADIIRPGMSVLMKPNWVLHYNQSAQGMDCMVTHPDFILAALKEVLAAQPSRVIIGDAPIQGCVFDELVGEEWKQKLFSIADCPLEILDFRKTVLETEKRGLRVRENRRKNDRYVLFDLKGKSLLDAVSRPPGRFRVTAYDPDQMRNSHDLGRHQYLLSREPFEVDVILNLPKLKTHKKAGMTGALKNLVGLSGDKNLLPHHRFGGSILGGDCYPGVAPLKRIAEYCLDEANRGISTHAYGLWTGLANCLLRVQRRIGDANIEGDWCGNDTIWRTVLDLNAILLHGRSDGSLALNKQRTIYSLTDAIVAGHGEGPLASSPFFLGAVTFASSAPFADLAHASLMGFDWEKIPLLRNSFGELPYPLSRVSPEHCQIRVSNQSLSLKEFCKMYGRLVRPSSGWKGFIEHNGSYS